MTKFLVGRAQGGDDGGWRPRGRGRLFQTKGDGKFLCSVDCSTQGILMAQVLTLLRFMKLEKPLKS